MSGLIERSLSKNCEKCIGTYEVKSSFNSFQRGFLAQEGESVCCFENFNSFGTQTFIVGFFFIIHRIILYAPSDI